MAKLKFDNGKRDNRSNIKEVHHDPATNTLTVHFHTGRSYAYANVPASKARAFQAADSKSKFLHANIIGTHPHTEITSLSQK